MTPETIAWAIVGVVILVTVAALLDWLIANPLAVLTIATVVGAACYWNWRRRIP